jgi:hypothetical protein
MMIDRLFWWGRSMMVGPMLAQGHYIIRQRRDRCLEAVVIFFLGLEALFTTVSWTQSFVDLSLHQALAAIGSYND